MGELKHIPGAARGAGAQPAGDKRDAGGVGGAGGEKNLSQTDDAGKNVDASRRHESASTERRSQHKSTLLGDLDRRRQHVLSRLENPRDKNPASSSHQETNKTLKDKEPHAGHRAEPERGDSGRARERELESRRGGANNVAAEAREGKNQAKPEHLKAKDGHSHNEHAGRSLREGDGESARAGRENNRHAENNGRSENDGRSGAPHFKSDDDDKGRRVREHVGERVREQAHSHGSHSTEGKHKVERLLNALQENVAGNSGAQHGRHERELPSDLKHALKTVSRVMGREWGGEVMRGGGERAEKILAYALRHAGEHGRALERGESPLPQLIDKLSDAFQLIKHFAQAEKKGGEVVRRAEEMVWRLLMPEPPPSDSRTFRERDSHPSSFRIGELLRDLRAGAFLPAEELNNPFPLTGRARVVSEMMELMHTLDAVERMMQRLDERLAAQMGGSVDGEFDLETLLRRAAASGADVPLEELLSMLPMLPGRAARVQMLRLMAALGAPLSDAQGRLLLSREGIPLKPEQLLWLNVGGGLLAGQFDAEFFSARLSPAILHGFDALYSLIGFDGRTLAAPHYAAVQVQVNASELEWMFGQPPLTQGWARALIERLKDSSLSDLNLLGEMLEEALLDGRFHTLLLNGTVAEGEAVADSFSISGLLPEAGDLPAFSPA